MKILPLIRNSLNQLSIRSAVEGNTPGAVYVDSRGNPKSGLIKTSECNVIFGESANKGFNEGIKKHIDYFDQIICDEPGWDEVLPAIHANGALRKYRRKYYCLEKSRYRESPSKEENPEIQLLYADTIGQLDYQNADIVNDWMVLEKPERFGRLCLGALAVVGDTIASCSLIDCISDKKIEIGIKTTKGFRKLGYGKKAVAAMVTESFRNGIEEIGWHCVSTNIGSIKTAERCGFRFHREYESNAPLPPIENAADLTKEQWEDYARFFEEKARDNTDHHWAASRCWAQANDSASALGCIRRLLENQIYWFIDLLDGSEEHQRFAGDAAWIELRRELESIDISG